MDIREKLVELLGSLTTVQVFCDMDGDPVSRLVSRVVAEEDVDGLADHLIANGVTVQEQKEMVCITTTDDFRDLADARAKGCYRKHYYCPSCNTEIGHQTFDAKRMFGKGTVLHSNKFPKYCHECGAWLTPPKGE